MKLDLNNKKFRPLVNAANGEVSCQTVFHYKQEGNFVFAEYAGGSIIKGQITGKIMDDDHLEFVYQHINSNGDIMTGKCSSYPETGENGKLLLKEYWQWTCGDQSKGESVIIEI
ncbi:MAG: hypothetical protein WAT19_11515 [Ferruginibacter sp.]